MAVEFKNIQIIRDNQRRGVPYQFLGELATYLRNYMSEFRNPSFYVYRMDCNGYYINDGGGDMFDDPGNITNPWLKSNVQLTTNLGAWSLATYPSASNYWQTGSVGTLDGDFQYISLGYSQSRVNPSPTQSIQWHPATVIGTRIGNGSVGYQTAGNSGADGSGTLVTGSIYSGSVEQGFTVHAFYRQQYAAGDPSHCNVYILLGHPNWGSTFGTVRTFSDNNRNTIGGALYSSGSQTSNLLAIHTLLSKNLGAQVSGSEVKTVVDNFIFRVKSALNY